VPRDTRYETLSGVFNIAQSLARQ